MRVPQLALGWPFSSLRLREKMKLRLNGRELARSLARRFRRRGAGERAAFCRLVAEEKRALTLEIFADGA